MSHHPSGAASLHSLLPNDERSADRLSEVHRVSVAVRQDPVLLQGILRDKPEYQGPRVI